MNFFRKHMQTIFLLTIIGFIGGIFIGFGGYFFGRGPGDAIAEVNGVKIPLRRYNIYFNQLMNTLRESNTEISDELIKQKRREVIQDLIQEEVFFQEAKRYGITVSDDELASDIQRIPAFCKDGRFDQETYFRVLRWRIRMTPQEFEETRRKMISRLKLQELIASGIKISEHEIEMEYFRRNKGDMKNYIKNKDNFTNELLKEKRNAVFNEWFKQLNQIVKLKVFLQE